MNNTIVITTEDLKDERVDEAIENESALRALRQKYRKVNGLRRFLFSSMFYTALVGAIGAGAGWALLEPQFDDAPSIGGVIRKADAEHVLGLCGVCGKPEPLDLGAGGSQPEHALCPDCREPLPPAALRPRGPFTLDRISFYIMPGKTRIVQAGESRVMQDMTGLQTDQTVRVTGVIVDATTFLATTVNLDTPPPGLATPGEPDLETLKRRNSLVGFFWFAVIGGLVALMVGAVEGVASFNPRQALFCGAIGLGIGFAGGLIGLIPAGLVYAIASHWVSLGAQDSTFFSVGDLHGMPLFGQIVGRSLAWGIVGIALALGQGVACKSKKLIINGLIGGCLGGLFGGMLFDPIAKWQGAEEQADLSRCIGFVTIGLLVGFFIGLVEHLSKDAWLLLRTGPLAGKQFVVHRGTTVFGSAPRCDVFLFKDSLVDHEHARLLRLGRAYEIEDLQTANGTFVNGLPVQKRILRDGDTVTIGTTIFEYRSRGG